MKSFHWDTLKGKYLELFHQSIREKEMTQDKRKNSSPIIIINGGNEGPGKRTGEAIHNAFLAGQGKKWNRES